MRLSAELEKEFQKVMATPIREILKPDQARNADRLKAWEKRKMEKSK